MADHKLFIGWGRPVRGREERSLDVFNEALGMFGRMQQDGRIEHFDVVILHPTTDLGGYIEVHGTAQQIATLRQDEAFMRNTADAELCVDGLRHVDGFAGEGVARQMAIFQDAISKVTQSV
jgi:hypothetical protein